MRSAIFGPPASLASHDNWIVRALGGGKTWSSAAVSEYTALQLPTIYACVNRIANPLAQFPLKIMQPGDGGSGAVEVTDHPLSLRLGLRPNDFMSSRTLRKTAQGHALLWGNGYVEIERDGGGRAVGLYPLLPWATHPERDGENLVYRTNIDGREFRIDQGDVLHIMDLSQDGYTGLSPITQARNAIGLAQALEEFGGKFFANDAKSGGFLMHPGRLSATAVGNIGGPKRAAQEDGGSPGARLEKQGGLDNAHRVKVLEEGMKFIQTTIPPEDAQFLGTRLMQIGEIARMYDVPLILLQSHDGTPSWGTGIEQLMIGFVRQTIQPWVVAWEQEMNWKLFTEEERSNGYYVKFNMNALLRGDMTARSQFYREMFAVGGISPNQICELEDMDPIGPDGDHHFVPINFTTLDRAINPPEPPAPATASPVVEPSAPTPLKKAA